MRSQQTLTALLSTRRALVGFLQSHPNQAVSEAAGMCGYDFLLIDCEHGWFSDIDIVSTLRTLTAFDTLAFVRVAGHDPRGIGRCLDMGADVIVVPDVRTAQEATSLVRAMDYPRTGTRGFGAPMHRSTRYGMDLASHLTAPHAAASLMVIIESQLGVENANAIMETPGVDGIIVGPSDLSANLGCLADYANPAYAEALRQVEQTASEKGKIIGTAPHPGSSVEALIARGHRLLIIGSDMPLIREAMSAQVSLAKSQL